MEKKITPCLSFGTQAEEAATFYVSVFEDSEVLEVSRYGDAGPMPAGAVLMVRFRLRGQEFLAFNGGPETTFHESTSFVIDCDGQAEVDEYWERLTDGGEESWCGWLKDRYGLSWQVVPKRLLELVQDADPGRAERAMRAMMEMRKIDVAALEAAADAG